MGKSRLAEELLHWASLQGILHAQARAYAGQDSLAFAPLVEMLRSEEMADSWADLSDVWLAELVHVLPEVLDSRPDLPRLASMPDNWRRRRLLEALSRAVLYREEPCILLLDDLQWCDRETLEWSNFILGFAPHAPLLLVGTLRPEEVTDQHPLTRLRLQLGQTGQIVEIASAATVSPRNG